MDDLEKRVVDLVAEVLVDVNKENIELNSKIVEDLGAESLDIYDMIALLEDEFGLEINDEEVEKIQTVQDVADFIREHKEGILIFEPTYSQCPEGIHVKRRVVVTGMGMVTCLGTGVQTKLGRSDRRSFGISLVTTV